MVDSWQFPGVPRSVTISAGVATCPDHGTTREELVRAADAGLYAAKQSGRNCVREALTAKSVSDAVVVRS
jgi:diguanylate cyclase (GGDEF)-like protein